MASSPRREVHCRRVGRALAEKARLFVVALAAFGAEDDDEEEITSPPPRSVVDTARERDIAFGRRETEGVPRG